MHQEHFEKKFYQDKKTGYWISCNYSKSNPRIRAHQWVWQQVNGKQPKGYHIHHINDDKSDNRIENLELIKASRHSGHHMQMMMKNPEFKKKCQENCEKIRPLTKKWHASEEGRAWHKYHAFKSKFGLNEPIDYVCQECDKPYKSRVKGENRSKFCSNVCKSRWRRKVKLDNVNRVCPCCQTEFSVNKYSKQRFCSRVCGKQKNR